jgi:hypothetical protein
MKNWVKNQLQPYNPRTHAPRGHQAGELTASALFELLWDGLTDILGTAATATLLRRALKQAATQKPVLNDIRIERQDLMYCYTLPDAWYQARDEQTMEVLRELGHTLVPLLIELTGPVVIRRLERLSPLCDLGILSKEQGL